MQVAKTNRFKENITQWLSLISGMLILLWDSFALVQLFRVAEGFDQEYGSLVSPEGMRLLERQHQNKDNGN